MVESTNDTVGGDCFSMNLIIKVKRKKVSPLA